MFLNSDLFFDNNKRGQHFSLFKNVPLCEYVQLQSGFAYSMHVWLPMTTKKIILKILHFFFLQVLLFKKKK